LDSLTRLKRFIQIGCVARRAHHINGSDVVDDQQRHCEDPSGVVDPVICSSSMPKISVPEPLTERKTGRREN
jgi:hypothetical protein